MSEKRRRENAKHRVTCMEAPFSSSMARHLQTPFLGGSIVTLDSLLGGAWIAFGSLLELFEGLRVPWDVLGAVVRVFWMPLGSPGLVLGSFGAHWAAEGVFKLNFEGFLHIFE